MSPSVSLQMPDFEVRVVFSPPGPDLVMRHEVGTVLISKNFKLLGYSFERSMQRLFWFCNWNKDQTLWQEVERFLRPYRARIELSINLESCDLEQCRMLSFKNFSSDFPNPNFELEKLENFWHNTQAVNNAESYSSG